ncbi:tyrosine-type recombinase/integrase [Aminobacterium colombiense]|uniref:tyrosine-type recombinase/integrase n=1 Tax=Aminobacterium colombiense TaxID=81468 RepID=UPI0006916B17
MLFVLGINSGLRVSDLLALKVSDVIDDRGNVRDRISMREKKTGKSKDFPIGKNARKAIQEYMENVETESELPLFQSKKGNGAITRVQAYRILNEAARTVGIRRPLNKVMLVRKIPLAYMWFNLPATKANGEEILRMRSLVSKRITVSLIGKALKLSRDWKSKEE